ncbi:Transcriptional regulator, LysR family protein [Minicystis rosea]|nr:Transcriptional regulator, LysR family protein [Minicystis rosea]
MQPKRPRATDYATRVEDVRDLLAFVRASDLRSLTAAARELGESKATLSRRITRLEEALGTALLRRSSRGIETTDDGALYRQRIGPLLEQLGDANAAAAHGGHATPSGQLRVSVPPGFADALSPLFAGFCEQFPHVVLLIHSSSRLVDLEAEHVDVAFRATSRLSDSSLVSLRVVEPRPEGILVAAPSYLATHPPPRRPQDLLAHRFLAVGETGAAFTLPLIKRGTTDVLEVKVPVAIAGSDLGLLRSLALAGAGITCLPRVSAADAIADGRLVHVLPAWVWPDVNLYLLHRGGRHVPPKVRAFLDYMRTALELRARKIDRVNR